VISPGGPSHGSIDENDVVLAVPGIDQTQHFAHVFARVDAHVLQAPGHQQSGSVIRAGGIAAAQDQHSHSRSRRRRRK
jgi:hypothetical protein